MSGLASGCGRTRGCAPRAPSKQAIVSVAIVSVAIVSVAIVSIAIVSIAIVSVAIVRVAIVSAAIVSVAIVSVAIVSIASRTSRRIACATSAPPPLHLLGLRLPPSTKGKKGSPRPRLQQRLQPAQQRPSSPSQHACSERGTYIYISLALQHPQPKIARRSSSVNTMGCCANRPASRSLHSDSCSLHSPCCSSCSAQPRCVRNHGSGAAGGKGGEGGGGGGGSGDGGRGLLFGGGDDDSGGGGGEA